MSRENTNIVITIPILTSLLQEATESYKQRFPDKASQITGTRVTFKLGYVTAKNGDLYVIDEDGTGSSEPVTDTVPAVIDLFAQITQGNGKRNLIEPSFTAKLRKSEILGMPTESQTVDLSRFIKKFGPRLEQNFEAWVKFLKPLV